MGIFSWAKYVKVIIKSEDEFTPIWNYKILDEDNTEEVYLSTVFQILYKNSEQANLTSKDYSKMVAGIRKSSPFYKLIAGFKSNEVVSIRDITDVFAEDYEVYLSSRKDGTSVEDAYKASERFRFDREDTFKSMGI
jgi:hypothetical protein